MKPPKLFPFVTPRMDPKPMRPDKPRPASPALSNQAAQRAAALRAASPTTKHPANKRTHVPTVAEVRAAFAKRHPTFRPRPVPKPSTPALLAMLGATTQHDVETGRTIDKAGYRMRNRAIRNELAFRNAHPEAAGKNLHGPIGAAPSPSPAPGPAPSSPLDRPANPAP